MSFGGLLMFALLIPDLSQVRVQCIEVTQAIQDAGNSVPLIANRRTIVRVYLTADTGWSVRGALHVKSGCGDVVVPSMNVLTIDTAMNANLALKRSTINGSLNFVIASCEGDAEVSIAGITHGSKSVSLAIDERGKSTRVTFEAPTILPLCIVSIPYKLKDGGVLMPRPVDCRLLRSWLLRAFPISVLSIRYGCADTIFEDSNSKLGIGSRAWNALKSFTEIDQKLRCDRRTHYYGVVYNDGQHFVRGWKGQNPTAGSPPPSFGPTGAPFDKYLWDTDSSFGDWYGAHEIGHQFYRNHIGCGLKNDDGMDTGYPYKGGFLSDSSHTCVGFDVGDSMNAPEIPMRPLRWDIHHDIMAYSVDLWPSDFTYRAILTRLRREMSMGSLALRPDIGEGIVFSGSRAPVKDECPGAEAISIIATVDTAARTGEISDVTHLMSRAWTPSFAESRVTLRLLDASGGILREDHGVTLSAVTEDCESGDCLSIASIDELISDIDGIDRIELRLDSLVVHSWKVPPIADRLDTSATIVPLPTGVEVRWPTLPGSDDNRNYLVQESLDDGRSWFLLAIERGSPGIALDRASYVGVRAVVLRVILDAGADSREVARTTVTF